MNWYDDIEAQVFEKISCEDKRAHLTGFEQMLLRTEKRILRTERNTTHRKEIHHNYYDSSGKRKHTTETIERQDTELVTTKIQQALGSRGIHMHSHDIRARLNVISGVFWVAHALTGQAPTIALKSSKKTKAA